MPGAAPVPLTGAGRARPVPRLAGEPWRSTILLGATTLALGAGVLCALVGRPAPAKAAWAAGTALALAVTATSVAVDLLHRSIGVDIIAVVALAGTLGFGEFAAGAVLGVMIATGRLLETHAAARAASDLRHLLAHAPRQAHRYERGGLVDPPLGAIAPGDLLLVKPGEVVPVDGRIEGTGAQLDCSTITGEAFPVTASRNDLAPSGATNVGDAFDLRAIATEADSTFSGIVRLVEQASTEKAPFVRLADRFAAGFVPLALGLAGLAWLATGDARRAVAVVVVATPCPLLLAAPIAIVSGLSRAARSGVIVKGGGVLERLASAHTVVFDKTGTVTRGRPAVTGVVVAPGVDPDEVLRLAASLEQVSPHLLASAVVREATSRGLRPSWPSGIAETLAQGIAGVVDGRAVRVGRLDWLGADPHAPWVRSLRRRIALDGSLSVYVALDGALAGAIVLDDPLRPDAARAVRALRAAGVERVVMATGDREAVAEAVGAVLGVDQVLAERTPQEKADTVRAERAGGTTVMVGDGVNDAAALAVADVGVALGARGASASSDAADVVLSVDRLDALVGALRIARRARRIALESVAVGMGLSCVAMVVAALGLLPALGGAVVQEGIDVVAIANALRVLLPGRGPAGLSGEDAELARRLEREHREFATRAVELRAVAGALDTLAPSEARARLGELGAFFTAELLPHERLEEEQLYPAVARLLGPAATATMSRSHVEIAHLVALYARLLDEVGEVGPDPEQARELRRVLYGLDAVLGLHNAQEDQEYLSLAAQEDAPPGTGPAPVATAGGRGA